MRLAQYRALGARVEPEHRDGAAAAPAESLQDLQRRGLAGAVRAEQGEDLPLSYVQVDAADGLEVAVAHAQVVHVDREDGSGRHRVGRRAGSSPSRSVAWRSLSAPCGFR